MRLRFASWNINSFNRLSGQIAYLAELNCDVIALQEVMESSYHEIKQANLFDWSAFSLSLRPPQQGEGRARKLGCAILGKTPFKLVDYKLLEEAPLPERTLIAEIDTTEGRLSACAFHAPPGVNWGEIKPASFKAITTWLSTRTEKTILGMDANGPKIDHPDHNKTKGWWKAEELLLGVKPSHNMNDSYRVFLAANPEIYQHRQEKYPNGPLAISYDRGSNSKPAPCRYDFIYITPDFTVENVQYPYSKSIEAGSDHSIVIADLKVN